MAASTFLFRRKPEFPCLAWLALLKNASPVIEVYHGDYVETHGGFFVEGVWAGEFAKGQLANNDCVFGSGGQIKDNRPIFVPSTGTTDSIYYRTAADTTQISNSLPLLLSAIGDRLDPSCINYAAINSSIIDGFRSYRSTIPTCEGSVERLIHRNLAFSGLTPSIIETPMPPHFGNYAEYKDMLRQRISLCLANARDPARASRLHIYSTQSKGYDTTAVNALARDFNIDAAFTVTKGKSNNRPTDKDARYQVDDDGTPICEVLGIKSISLNRRQFEVGITDELFYWSGTHSTSDLNLCGIALHMESPALLLTGVFGEIWYGDAMTESHTISDELVRLDISGHCLSEIRLKAGYTQMSVPLSVVDGAPRFCAYRNPMRWRPGA
jgi:hypothetical protein